MTVRTRHGIAVDWEAGVVAMARDLSYVLCDGDIEGIRAIISIIDSWAISSNPEEVRAYRVFTSVNPYKRLYREAKKLINGLSQ